MTGTRFNKIDISHLQRRPRRASDKFAKTQQVDGKEINFLTLLAGEKHQQKKTERFSLRPAVFKSLGLAGSGLLMIFIIQALIYLSAANSAKSDILGVATTAYTQLNSAGKNLNDQNFGEAQSLFDQAQTNIQKAQDRLNDYKVLQFLAPQAQTAQHVLLGAGFLAEAGQKLTTALSIFNDLKVSSSGVTQINFNQEISSNRDLLVSTRLLFLKAQNEFESAGNIPLDYEGAFAQAKDQVASLGKILEALTKMEDLYLALFSEDKTYFLAFENNDEIRATGGFIGTYGVLHTSDGQIRNLSIQSIYNLDGQIHDQIAAPGPFQPDIKKWGIRDANWFVDFPTSAKKLLEFFEAGSQTADGVIAMTPQMFKDLLNLTGPIEMSDYQITLTSDNFQDVVQFKTSKDYDKVLNQPKKFLDDFAPVLLDRLSQLSKEQWFTVLQIISKNLNSRQVILYSINPETQKLLADAGFAGQLLDSDFDYLQINNTNLGGTKTDLEMHEDVELSTKILSDGSVINTLQIVRTNNSGELNKDYLRVLVPNGSQFISATGFDQYDYYKSQSEELNQDPQLKAWDEGQLQSNVFVHTESGKTEFSGWVNSAPHDSRTVTLVYILPMKVGFNSVDSVTPYSLLLQKQSGSLPMEFNATVDLGNWQSKWGSTKGSDGQSVININSESNTDDFWAWLLTK